MSSPILKSFTFVPQPKPSSDPLIIKRERMIARLEDQKKLLADPNFVRTVKRWERKEGGEKVLVERPLADLQVVAARSERRLRDDREDRIEAHRVREGQGGNCRGDRWRSCRA